jgi:hypothetical protein
MLRKDDDERSFAYGASLGLVIAVAGVSLYLVSVGIWSML